MQMTVRSYLRAAALAGAFLGLAAPAAFAQSDEEKPVITLKSFDGITQLRGSLVEFDGKAYVIETPLGMMSIDALQVRCEGDGCPQNAMFGAKFGVHGAHTIGAELMPALIEGYADTLEADLVTEVGAAPFERTLRIVHRNGEEMAAIDLQSKGSATAFRSLAAGAADIGMASRRARDRDMPALFNAGLGDPRDTDAEHVIGLDGLIVVTNSANPITSISLEEVALVFSGSITSWKQLGGPDVPISVYVRDEESGTYQTFESVVMLPFGAKLTPSAKRFASNLTLSDSVAGDPAGIGITTVAYERAAKALAIRQECGILSYPTTFAMKTGEYPLSRRLFLYAPRAQMTAHARNLIAFAKSPDAQPLIIESGFVSMELETAQINDQGARLVHAITGEEEVSLPLLRDFVLDVKSAVRLSTTLRFTPGESRLDSVSQIAAEELAREIAEGVYAGKEILLLGFTDSVGQFDLNQGLSARRARVVADVLAASVEEGGLSKSTITVKGYGELAPVACNTSPGGRSANRRVEVWVRDPV